VKLIDTVQMTLAESKQKRKSRIFIPVNHGFQWQNFIFCYTDGFSALSLVLRPEAAVYHDYLIPGTKDAAKRYLHALRPLAYSMYVLASARQPSLSPPLSITNRYSCCIEQNTMDVYTTTDLQTFWHCFSMKRGLQEIVRAMILCILETVLGSIVVPL